MEIDVRQLRDLIDKRKKYINPRSFPWETLFSFLVFSVSIFGIYALNNLVWFIISLCVDFIYLLWLIYSIVQFCKYKYSPENLFDDICSLSKREHSFSLLVIKNGNEYLMKYDRRWKCYLLPYYSTKNEDDEGFIKTEANGIVGEAKFINSKKDIVTKFSYSDNMEKTYNHTFYFFSSDKLKKKFKINSSKYKWYTEDELKLDKKIQERNSETVRYILENF